MKRWGTFAAEAPEMAEAGRTLIYQFGVGLGLLATVRRDGAPRIHPFCPVLAGEGLYGFILPESPKCGDLLRDGRAAIHTYPPDDRDDEFFLNARARLVEDPAERSLAKAAYNAPAGAEDHELLFEFLLERVLLATYRPRAEGNTWPPVYSRWRA